MANNVILSLHLSYSENTISNLNPNHLYRHVLKTTQQLGIPSPARAHVKKVDDGTVFVEHLSFLPSGLKKLEKAIATAGNLWPTLGLISISSSNHNSNKKTSSQPQRSNSPTCHPPRLSSRVAKDSNASTERSLESRLSQNTSGRLDECNVSDVSLQPAPSTLQKKAPETFRIQRRYPSLTLPRKPSWVPDPIAHSHSMVPKAEPISPAMSTPPLGNVRFPRVQDPSVKGRTSGTEGPSKTQPFLKRENQTDTGRENGEPGLYKRPRLENGSSSPHERTSRTNKKKRFSTSSTEPDEHLEANMQSLRTNVSDLERSLHKEKTQVTLLRQELDEERRKRHRAELIVEDIRREMKDPFIVPSLLDAFITLTDISEICMGD